MANIIDYVKWKGDASFADRPFNIVDNLVFSELSYLELPDTLFSEEPLTIRKVWEKLGENAKFRLVTSSNDEIELLKACALSERFSCVSISDYEDSCSDLQETQFAAMTFHLSSEEAFIAFRGTDDTILGWKEDFMLCYCKVPAQERALQYIEKMIAGGKRYYVGGHSKGANLALFGAAYLRNNKDSLIKVYLNDGPGFCNDVLDSNRISLIDDKSHLLALGIVLPQGVGLHHREVVDTHHRLNAVSQRLRFLFGDRTFRQVVDVGQDATHDNSHEGEHQHHIQ